MFQSFQKWNVQKGCHYILYAFYHYLRRATMSSLNTEFLNSRLKYAFACELLRVAGTMSPHIIRHVYIMMLRLMSKCILLYI